RVGSRAALFNRKENVIQLHSPEELWPGVGPVSDFSIELWIKPTHFSWKNSIIRKRGLGSSLATGRETTFELFLQHRRVQIQFRNLFRDVKNRRRMVRLVSRSTLRARQWTHVIFSYS